MSIIYILLILLTVTRIFGEVVERLGKPALLGELVSGICLGMRVHHYDQTFPTLAGLTDNEVFRAITHLGIFFLMLLGEIELSPVKLLEASKGAFDVAAGGMLIPCAARCPLHVFRSRHLRYCYNLDNTPCPKDLSAARIKHHGN